MLLFTIGFVNALMDIAMIGAVVYWVFFAFFHISENYSEVFDGYLGNSFDYGSIIKDYSVFDHYALFKEYSVLLVSNITMFFYFLGRALILGVLRVILVVYSYNWAQALLLLFILAAAVLYFLERMHSFFNPLVLLLFVFILMYGSNSLFFGYIIPNCASKGLDGVFLSLLDGKEYYLSPKGLLNLGSIIEYWGNNGTTGTAVVEPSFNEFSPSWCFWKDPVGTDHWNYGVWRASQVSWYNLLTSLVAVPLLTVFNGCLDIFLVPQLFPFVNIADSVSLLYSVGWLVVAYCKLHFNVCGVPESLFLHSVVVSNECEILVIYIGNKLFEFYRWAMVFENTCFIVHSIALFLVVLYLFFNINGVVCQLV